MTMTREEWLNKAVLELKNGVFKDNAIEFPDVKVSVGFPGGGSARKRIGEYWHPDVCKGIPNIFISPVLDSGMKALDVLAHELVHAATPGDGHRKAFGKAARAIGLEGKLTATVAGDKLKAILQGIADTLGEYPHGGIDLSKRKKQATNMLKVSCDACGYILYTTRKWLDTGTPSCPCNDEPMLEA